MVFDPLIHRLKAVSILEPLIEDFLNIPQYELNDLPNFEGAGVYALYLKSDEDTVYKGKANIKKPMYIGKKKVDSIDTRKLMEYASWRDNKMGSAKEEVRIRGLRNKIKDYQRLKEELGKEPKPFKAKKSTINTHNSALNRVFDEALLRGWITDSIKPTVLNKGIKAESRGAFSLDEYQAIYTGLRSWTGTGHRQETRELREVLPFFKIALGAYSSAGQYWPCCSEA